MRGRRRGVDVAVILDKSTQWQGDSGATFVAHTGIPVWFDHPPGIAHNKVIVIDRHMTIGGSLYYTAAANTRNAENVTFTECPRSPAGSLRTGRHRGAVSLPYTPRN